MQKRNVLRRHQRVFVCGTCGIINGATVDCGMSASRQCRGIRCLHLHEAGSCVPSVAVRTLTPESLDPIPYF